jgi:urease accessory protein
MTWLARLDLDYTLESERSVARYLHQGPLRILQSLYPEGDAICHNVLVHPPNGLVGGDTLDMHVTVGPGAHGLVTTPGATRFYRSDAGLATQQVHARVAAGARLEWLPLEAIAYNHCDALNRAVFELAPGAEMMTWDTTALGLPAADLPFAQGTFRQHLEIPGVWLERGCIDAQDERLMNSPLGLAGQRCMATLVFAAGSHHGRAEPLEAPAPPSKQHLRAGRCHSPIRR